MRWRTIIKVSFFLYTTTCWIFSRLGVHVLFYINWSTLTFYIANNFYFFGGFFYLHHCSNSISKLLEFLAQFMDFVLFVHLLSCLAQLFNQGHKRFATDCFTLREMRLICFGNQLLNFIVCFFFLLVEI